MRDRPGGVGIGHATLDDLGRLERHRKLLRAGSVIRIDRNELPCKPQVVDEQRDT